MGDYSNFTDLYYDTEIIGDDKKESLMIPDQLQIRPVIDYFQLYKN